MCGISAWGNPCSVSVLVCVYTYPTVQTNVHVICSVVIMSLQLVTEVCVLLLLINKVNVNLKMTTCNIFYSDQSVA